MLLLELSIELVRIAVVQVDECRFRRVLIHLTKASTGGLQHHILRAVALLREDDPSQAAAVPALLADLNQQNNADFRNCFIQRIKLHLAVGRLGILLIALVELENGVAAKAAFRGDFCDKRVNKFFQLFDGSAVDAQLCDCAIGIDGILVGFKKFTHTGFNDTAAVRKLRNLHHRTLEKISNTVNERVVIHDICNLRCGD